MLGLFDDDSKKKENKNDLLKQNNKCPQNNSHQMNATIAANILLELNSPSGVSDINKDNSDITDETNDDSLYSSSEDNVSDDNDTEFSKTDTIVPKIISKNGKVPTNVTVKIFNVLQQIISSNCDYQPVTVTEKVSMNKTHKEISTGSETNIIVYESLKETETVKPIVGIDSKSMAMSHSNLKPSLFNDSGGFRHASEESILEPAMPLDSNSYNCSANADKDDTNEENFDATNMLLYVTKDVIENICNIYNKYENYEVFKNVTDNFCMKTDTPLLQITKKLNFYVSFINKNKFDNSTNNCTCIISLTPVSEHSILCTYKSNRPFTKKTINTCIKYTVSNEQKSSNDTQPSKQKRSLNECVKEKSKPKRYEIENKPLDGNSDSKYNLRHLKIDFRNLIGMTNKYEFTEEDSPKSRANNTNFNKKRKIKSPDENFYKKHKAYYEDFTINAENRVYIETDEYDDDEYDILKYHKLMNKNLSKNVVNHYNKNHLVLDKEIRIILKKCDSADYVTPNMLTEYRPTSDPDDIFDSVNDTDDFVDHSDNDDVEETIENIELFVTRNCSTHISGHNVENDVIDSTNDSVEDTKENILDEISSLMCNVVEKDSIENKVNIITNIKFDISEQEIVDLSEREVIREIDSGNFICTEDDQYYENVNVNKQTDVENLTNVEVEKNIDLNNDIIVVEKSIDVNEDIVVAEKNIENEDIVVAEKNIENEDIVVAGKNIDMNEDIVVAEKNIDMNEDIVVAEKNIDMNEDIVVAEKNIDMNEDIVVAEKNIVMNEDIVVPEKNIDMNEDIAVAEKNIVMNEDIVLAAYEKLTLIPKQKLQVLPDISYNVNVIEASDKQIHVENLKNTEAEKNIDMNEEIIEVTDKSLTLISNEKLQSSLASVSDNLNETVDEEVKVEVPTNIVTDKNVKLNENTTEDGRLSPISEEKLQSSFSIISDNLNLNEIVDEQVNVEVQANIEVGRNVKLNEDIIEAADERLAPISEEKLQSSLDIITISVNLNGAVDEQIRVKNLENAESEKSIAVNEDVSISVDETATPVVKKLLQSSLGISHNVSSIISENIRSSTSEELMNKVIEKDIKIKVDKIVNNKEMKSSSCESVLPKSDLYDQSFVENCNEVTIANSGIKSPETVTNGISVDGMIIANEIDEQVYHEVTIASDGSVEQVIRYKTNGEKDIVNTCDGSDNVLHEFITINNKTSNNDERSEVVFDADVIAVNDEVVNEPALDVSCVGKYNDVVVIEKVVEGLVDDDTDDDDEDYDGDFNYVGDTDNVVIVQGHVNDVIEEDIEDEIEDDINDELFSNNKVIYCTYNETDNVMERVSENLDDVEYVIKLDDTDVTAMEDGVLMKTGYNGVIKDVDDCMNEMEHFQRVDDPNGTGKLLGIYRCNICLKEINRDSMRRHLKRHTGVKFCPYCSKSYCDIVKYNEHVSLHKGNEGKEKYMCYICRKKFCFLKNIYKHLRNAHPNDTKNDTIILLPDNGVNNRNNIFGIKDKKIKKRMKNCPVCNRLVTNFYYRRHLQSHSGERPFACPLCEKRFYEKSTLKNHLRTHTGERPYKCEYCWKTFGHVSTLAKHSNIHTGAKKFQCEICNKSVSSSYNLKLHHRIHTGEKPFGCDCCGKNFTSKAGLDKHITSSHTT